MKRPSVDEQRRAVFEAFAVVAERELGDELVDLEITPELEDEIVSMARDLLGLEGCAERAHMPRREEARRWLQSPETFSPFIDEIAVRRGMEFDWPVIENMTSPEFSELARRLAELDDPWEAKPDIVDQLKDHATRWFTFDSEPEGQVSERRQRFVSGPKLLRNRLQKAVGRARAKAEREALAA